MQMHGARAQLRAGFQPRVGLFTTRVVRPSRSISATSCAPVGAGQSMPPQQQAATTAAVAGGQPPAPPTSSSTLSSDPGEPSNNAAQALNWVATQSALAAPAVMALAAVVGVAACATGGVRKLDEITSGLQRVEKAQSDFQKEVRGEFSQMRKMMLAMAVMMWIRK